MLDNLTCNSAYDYVYYVTYEYAGRKNNIIFYFLIDHEKIVNKLWFVSL